MVARAKGGGWRGRARGALAYAVAGVAGFTIAYLAVYLFVFPTSLVADDRPVPDVRGQLVEDAERAVRQAGFVPRDGERRADASVVPGTVVAQRPAPTTARPPGATVVLDVAVEP